MASWRVRQSYGFGAGRVPLAPVFAPGPFSAGDSLANDLAGLAAELEMLDRRAIVRRFSGGLALAIAVTLTLVMFTKVSPRERDLPVQDLVLIEPEPVVPEPEPEPVIEPEPEPVEVAKVEPPPPPPPPPMAKPKPAPPPPPPPPPPRVKPPAAKPPPPPVKAEPVRPPPQLKIDAIAKAPEPPPRVVPVVREEPPKKAPTIRMDPVAPRFAVAATAPPAGQAAPLRAPAREPVRKAPPVAFALGPVPAARADVDPTPAPQVARVAPRSAPSHAATSPMPHFDPVAPPPTQYTQASPKTTQQAVERVVRTAAREETAAPAPKKAFQGVPLGSLAACVSDREEDGLKLEVMKAAGARTSCSSRAGNYRFVETKNLNAFLMWIERSPSRKAADRCIELKLALECLAATPNRRTDNG